MRAGRTVGMLAGRTAGTSSGQAPSSSAGQAPGSSAGQAPGTVDTSHKPEGLNTGCNHHTAAPSRSQHHKPEDLRHTAAPSRSVNHHEWGKFQ